MVYWTQCRFDGGWCTGHECRFDGGLSTVRLLKFAMKHKLILSE